MIHRVPKTIILVYVFLCSLPIHGQSTDPAPDFSKLKRIYQAEIFPIIRDHCLECHDSELEKGELNLERFDSLEAIRRDPKTWQDVQYQIKNGEMPPKNKSQLSKEHSAKLTSWIKNYLDAEALSQAGDPGPVLVRRLTNAELTYSVRDLTGISSLNPAGEFPVDNASGEGFPNAGFGQSMSPALFEKYLGAAKDITSHLVLLPDGIRFSEFATGRDWANELVQEIQAFYNRMLHADELDLTYRNIQVGPVIPSSPAEGRVDLKPYIQAIIEHREELTRNPESAASIAGSSQGAINEKYLRTLSNAMLSRPADSQNFLLNELSDLIKSNDAIEVLTERVMTWIEGWKSALWQFNSVGHFGLLRPWQSPINPSDHSTRLEKTLSKKDLNQDGEVELVFQTVSIGNKYHPDKILKWNNPHLEISGNRLLRLADAGRFPKRVMAVRDQLLSELEEILKLIKTRAPSEHHQVPEGITPEIFHAVKGYLGSGGAGNKGIQYLNHKLRQTGGIDAINGWGIEGLGDLSLLSNASDQEWNIPGLTPPRSIVVHPRPERWVAAGWESPNSMQVDISALVIDRHGCGNGTRWILQHEGRFGTTSLHQGNINPNQAASIPTIKNHSVRKGDKIALIIDSRDNNHACDLTQIDLTLTSSGDNETRWQLSEDCANSIHLGNPHPGHQDNHRTWHFYSGLTETLNSKPSFPQESQIAQWLREEDKIKAGEMARGIVNILKGGSTNHLSPADQKMYRDMTHPFGPLLSQLPLDFILGEDKDKLLNRSRSPGIRSDADGKFKVSIPGLFAGHANFVVSAEIESEVGEFSPWQIILTSGVAEVPQRWNADLPIIIDQDPDQSRSLNKVFDEFRSLFPIAMSYSRIVPIDEVVTVTLYHREDSFMQQLMLSPEQKEKLDQLWRELRFVSQEAFQTETALEQILEFATQDDDPTKYIPLKAPVKNLAESLSRQWEEAGSKHLTAVINLAEQAWRRPLMPNDRQSLNALYANLLHQNKSHDEAIRMVLARILSSAQFLYRLESSPRAINEKQRQVPVNSYELASRLSYFIWSSLPDHELTNLARSGSLNERQTLVDQTSRMLRHPRIIRLAEQFAGNWLHVIDFDQHNEKNLSLFPEFERLRGSMNREYLMFFTHLIRENRSILEILGADFTFVDQQLARHYGMDLDPDLFSSSPDGWQRIEGVSKWHRGGILTMGATLAKNSGASRSSPILRGNWIFESLLGEKLPKPPPGVPPLPDTPASDLDLTVIEMTQRHSADPACSRCHKKIDPLGFGLENFDTIGRWREFENSGTSSAISLPDGTGIESLNDLRSYLIDKRKMDFARQFCKKLLGYALGREIQLSDSPLLEMMLSELANNEFKIHTAFHQIVLNTQFREIRTSRNSLQLEIIN